MKHVFITFISAIIIIKYNYNIIHINAEFVQKYKKFPSDATLWAELANCRHENFCSPIQRVASVESTRIS